MTRGRVDVSPVRSRADAAAFLELPYRLYRRDPNWVPPLRRLERLRWSPRHNASLRERTSARFLARRDGAVIGRVAAIADPGFARRWGRSAFFGCFECEDNAEAVRALLTAAENSARAQGMEQILGPINGSTHDEVGLLVQGFDSSPMVLSPYNPPHYPALIEAAGFVMAEEYHSYLWIPQVTRSPALERAIRAAANGRALDGLRIRALDPRRWTDELHVLHALYNACFTDVWGFVPLTWEEFVQRANDFKPFYRPELVRIAEVAGRPVGFGVVLPDVNEALGAAGGRLLPFGWLRLARSIRRVRSARFILLGVQPEFTGRGIAPWIAREMEMATIALGIERAELSLVNVANRAVRHVIEAFGCTAIKTYRLYGKAL
jgi:GNAT superfamily N-acetyltransferase